jgi:hypothetical protein
MLHERNSFGARNLGPQRHPSGLEEPAKRLDLRLGAKIGAQWICPWEGVT